MIEDLLFSLERVTPFFLLIVLGYVLVRWCGIRREFFSLSNQYVYGIALPVNLFCTIAAPTEKSASSPGLFGYILGTTVLSFGVIWVVSEVFFRDKAIIGTLVQGAFRGNIALLGAPLALAVAGTGAAQKSAIGMVAAIPLYNLLSVVVLMARSKNPGKPKLREMLRGIVTNRLILGIGCGLLVTALGIRIPPVLGSTLNYVGQTATPLGLMSIGGLFQLCDATARLRPALFSVAIKNLILPVVFVPLAVLLGFRGDDLLVMLLVFAAPAAVSSYPMAVAMGGDGPLASNILIITTLLSSVVFAGGIYLLRVFGQI